MRFLVFAAVLGAAPAHAAMLEHYDLAGLVLESDAIVTADKLGTAGHDSRYRITRVLRGAAKAGDEIVVYDSLYATAGKPVDPNVYLFIRRGRDGAPYLVSSGMRVVVSGKVYRFEQWSNPGGFVMVPQGTDPVDNWRATAGPVDVSTFERALGDAIHKIDALAVLRKLPDPMQRRTMLLALLAVPGQRAPAMGFYRDALAEEVTQTLAAAGDLEGALMAFARDRSFASLGRGFGTLPALLAIANHAGKPIDVRVSALAVASGDPGFYQDATAVHAVIALFDDADPRVRATAVAAAARIFGVITNDTKAQAANRKLARDARAAMEARLAKETDPGVMFAIAEAFGDAVPSRKGGPVVVAVAHAEAGTIMASVRCLARGHKYDGAKVRATHDGKPVTVAAYNVSYSCGSENTGTFTTGGAPLPTGLYDVSIALRLDGKPLVVHAGEVFVD